MHRRRDRLSLLVGERDAACAHERVLAGKAARKQRASGAGTADVVTENVDGRRSVVLTALVEQLEWAGGY